MHHRAKPAKKMLVLSLRTQGEPTSKMHTQQSKRTYSVTIASFQSPLSFFASSTESPDPTRLEPVRLEKWEFPLLSGVRKDIPSAPLDFT